MVTAIIAEYVPAHSAMMLPDDESEELFVAFFVGAMCPFLVRYPLERLYFLSLPFGLRKEDHLAFGALLPLRRGYGA